MATILVIDDDPQICDLLRQVLEKEGHAVHMALNGLEGISLYRQHHPELILLDILMPEKEGLETILDLRRAQYQLTKPFQLQTVIELVNTALDKKGNGASSEGLGEASGPDEK